MRFKTIMSYNLDADGSFAPVLQSAPPIGLVAALPRQVFRDEGSEKV
jgi:hypothetical protein